MVEQFPSSEDVRKRLKPLTDQQVQALAKGSGVSYFTLLKIRSGVTKNPGIETVGQFWELVSDVERGWDGVERRHAPRAAKAVQ